MKFDEQEHNTNFEIVDVVQFKNAYALHAKFLTCPNCGGFKIMVFKGEYTPKTYLDPHFNFTDECPIARFKPTVHGWNLAIDLAVSL
jgi:hypothetical protein